MEDGVPLTWQSVRAEALRRISSGEWSPGELIPNEADWAMELGCARTTVNRALRDLAEAGYLDRRRKGGTRVPLTPVRRATLEIAIIRQDVEARGLPYGYRLLHDAPAAAPPGIRAALRLPGGAALRHIRALHLAGGAPYCLEDRWLNPDFAPGARFETVSANEWLVRNLAWSGGDFTFYARPADAGLAGLLACPEGAALFAVDRTTFAAEAPITAVTLTYAPGYRMTTSV